MIYLLKYWKVIAVLLIVLAYSAAVWRHGYSTRDLAAAVESANERARAEQVIAEFARAERDAVQAAREAEQAHAANLAAIAAQHEKDKRDAEAAAADVIAGLRAGSIRLRQHWRGCEATSRVSGDATSAALANAAARLREEGAGAFVRDGREADDWIKRLQDVTRSDRAK